MSITDENGYLKDPYSQFIHSSRYARWLEKEGRRETWTETVTRCVAFLRNHLQEKYGVVPEQQLAEIFTAIHEHEIMPSMRLLWTAGDALKKDNIASYNCAFIAIDDFIAFDEIMYVLMNGCGMGFSVEHKYVDKLPIISNFFHESDEIIVVDDSKEGWANAYRILINRLAHGLISEWDVSKIRPAGSRLKTFGGRASGPGPLVDLFNFTVAIFKGATGRKLRPIEVHDIVCKIAVVVVSGGVRRSALISLSDLDDVEMANAKHGEEWKNTSTQRYFANNSAVYTDVPSKEMFWKEWKTLQTSGSGERGIFNLYSARNKATKRDASLIVGTNPCGEILLRSMQTCNLTEVIVKKSDTLISLRNKVQLATILGTWQSTLTDFTYLRPEWKKNCEEERLLGVSFTGIFSSELMTALHNDHILSELRELAVMVNEKEASNLKIRPSASITCVKPSGTVSELVGCSSGIHPWHSKYYIRSVRGNDVDPLTQTLKAMGIPNKPDKYSKGVTIFRFPKKAPEGAIVSEQVSAIQHLKLWKHYLDHWTEHNPSVTITVKDDQEWDEVGQWVFENFANIGSAAFLPLFHGYEDAPYQAISEAEYHEALAQMPTNFDWSNLTALEKEDNTIGAQTLACSGDACAVVDIV
jgi:ribonucleoside-diphosphate reductase alpha chain